MKVKSINKVKSNLKVYDFTVDDVHHYVLDNGVISHNSYVPMKEIGGGTGLKYAASTICMLTKKKDKEGTDVVGNIIKARMYKSRLTKENKDVEVRLSFTKGLDRYYGLLELAEKHGLVKKVSTRIEMPDGTKVFAKSVYSEPEKYFTQEFLDRIDKAAKKEFMYGSEDEGFVSDSAVSREAESTD